MSSSGVTRQVIVDDTNPSIIFTGTWSHDQGISGVASASDEKLLGPAFNGTATFSETDASLSFTFSGTQINVNGGINFVPTGTFGRCFIDGVATDNSTDLMIGSGIVGTNDNPLCIDSELSDSTHVLTFNLSGIGTYTPAPGANGATNAVWVDEIIYTPSTSVAMDTVPAVMVLPGDSQINYSAGWEADSNDGAQITQQQNASVTFTFQGTSIDYYGTLLNNPQTITSSATFSIDGQTPTTVSLVAFSTGSTPNNTPLFRSGTLPAGKHTLTVVNQGNSTVIPLGLQYLIIVPSAESASTNTTTTTAGTTPTTGTTPTKDTTPATNTTTNTASTPAGSTSVTSPPNTSPGSLLNSSKKHSSAAKIGAIVAVVVGLVFIIFCLLLFLRRRRQKQAARFRRTSVLRDDLEYPDISGIPPPEIPTPFPLPKPQLGNNEMVQHSQDPFVTTPPNQQYNSAGEKIRKLGNALPLLVQGATVPSQSTSDAANPPSIQLSPSGKASAARTRPLSDLIINHDDSGMRIPQPEEEMTVRRIVEFPPTYAP